MNKNDFPPSEENKLNIYFHISENSGVGYYRQYLPAVTLRNKKIANVMISDFRWGEGNHVELTIENLFDVFNWADLIVVGRRDVPQFYAQWGGVREFFNVPVIMDTDDNVQFVRPTNPGYQGYYPGSDAHQWNKYAVGKVFDAITVSTKDLYDFYKKLNPKIFILPNSLDIAEWKKYEKRVWNDGFTCIAFIGSAAHQDGIDIIKKPILRIMQEFPNVKFLITHVYNFKFRDFPEEVKKRIEFVPWIKLQEWPKGLQALGIDIGLAPLADNMFNRAKSNLRWMEYGMAQIATIASPVSPYLCIRDGVDGLLAKEKEEWYNEMKRMITDEQFRTQIAEKARERVSTEFDIDKNITLWENVYTETHRKFHEYFGPKKRFMKMSKKGQYREIIHGKSLIR